MSLSLLFIEFLIIFDNRNFEKKVSYRRKIFGNHVRIVFLINQWRVRPSPCNFITLTMSFFVWLEPTILTPKSLFSKYTLPGIGLNFVLIRLASFSGRLRVINGGLPWDFIGRTNEKGQTASRMARKRTLS